jgi:hypothetical protein
MNIPLRQNWHEKRIVFVLIAWLIDYCLTLNEEYFSYTHDDDLNKFTNN